MTISGYDEYRPEDQRRRRRGGKKRMKRRKPGFDTGGDGQREASMALDFEFDSYYGRPVVKAPPWGDEISIYLFLGGLAGGSSILAAGADLSGLDELRRNARATSMVALGGGTVALIMDLGRPERFLNMMRTFKVSSPMNMGSWLLGAYGGAAGTVAAIEIDRLTGEKLPLGPLRKLVQSVEKPTSVVAALLGAPLASYTGALLGDTSVPTWAAARDNLSYLFVSSASMAAGGVGMMTTSTEQARPARLMAVAGAIADLYFSKALPKPMHPLEAEPLKTGKAGAKLKWAERLTIAGGLGAALFGGHRLMAFASGVVCAAASALTRFGILEAGLESTKDPRRVIEPQKERLEKRRAQGILDDSITTAG